MNQARWRALFILIALLAGAAALVVANRHPSPIPPRAPGERPTLMLLTSLPLLFADRFSLDAPGSPALAKLEQHYRVVPISVTSPAELARGGLLLMAHPLAQTAENLVALDHWVRSGGRVLLLADPMLEWPSERPIGDLLRPPPMFADTGLLAHWGLRLDAPDERGPRPGRIAGYDVMTMSPGRLQGGCRIESGNLVARCRIGSGRATVIADADLLDLEHLDGATEDNLDAVVSELARLED